VALQQKKVDVIFLGFSTAPAAKLVQDCQAQGYNPIYEGTTQVLGPQLLLPGAVMYGLARAFPWQADAPAVTTFKNAMAKYAKSDNWKEGTGTPTWTALEAVRKALSNVSATATVTPKDVMDGLNSFKDENIDGLSPNKVTFTAGQSATAGSQPCFFVVQIKNQQITAPQGLTPVCPTGL